MMVKPGTGSLARRLTLRLVVMQIIIISVIFAYGVFPFTVVPLVEGLGDEPALDPRPAALFASLLTRSADGAIAIGSSRELDALRKDFPNIWFYADDGLGHSTALGEMPAGYANVKDNISRVAALEIRPQSNDPYTSLLLRAEKSPVGPVKVMAGSGPVLGVSAWIRPLAAALGMGITIAITIASIIIIPLLVRMELRGIATAAEEAEGIDIDRRGTRLPTNRVPAEVRSLVEAVNGALSRLDEAYIRRERFLADAAHELRTPIAIVQSRLETSSPFPEKGRLQIDVARLSSLAGQLLDLERLSIESEPSVALDLTEIAATVVGDLAPLAIAGGYELSISIPDHPVWVRGDGRSLERAFTNVVQNAIAYGGNLGEIQVAVTEAATVSISDSGPGIPDAERERIFEPFYRIRPSSIGTGLGLNLAEEIIQRHGGSISVSRSTAGGARFQIDLPPAANLPPVEKL